MLGSSFSIKIINNPLDKEYIKSIAVYNRTTPVCIKTDSNEIAYWINNKNDKFQIYVFSLFIKNINVGFAMTTFLKKEKILIIDYLALDAEYKNNTVFLSFFTLIQLFFHERKMDINYFMVEISNKNNGIDVDKESQMFLKFLCLEDFFRVNHEYNSLPLGTNNPESCFSAYLYLKSIDSQHAISRNTFINLISSLYNDYYLEWYKPFFSSQEIIDYQNHITQYLNNLKDSIPQEATINLDFSCCRNIDKYQKTNYSNIPLSKFRNKKFYIILLIMLMIPIPIIWMYNFILEQLGIPITSVNAILGAVLGAIFAAILSIIIAKKHS